jgi:uncharacterized membrane protein YhhN
VMFFAARRPDFAQRLPLQVHLVALGIVFANAFVIGLTLIGILVGALHHRFGGGPGSGFSIGVTLVFLAVAVIYMLVRRRVRSGEAPAVLISLGVSAAAFAILTPWLGTME